MGGPQPSPDAPQLPPLRVLLAEDSPFNQKLVAGLLEPQGHRVEVVDNGCAALEALDRDEFDLVLMDVQMPQMDGLEATAQIRSRESDTGRHVPIVAMTARDQPRDREKCLAAGMDSYVAKPIGGPELLQAIADALAGCQSAAAASRSSAPGSESSGEHAMPTSDLIDWQAALDGVEGKVPLLVELVKIFFDESPQLLSAIEQALHENDAAALQLSAHRLKGCLRYFGENPAAQLAFELEELGRGGTIEEAAERLDRLRAQIEQMLPSMRQFVEKVEG